MGKGRLEAFSDGVIAIIITIMVREMKAHHGVGLSDLSPLIPVFLCYVLTFVYIGILEQSSPHAVPCAQGQRPHPLGQPAFVILVIADTIYDALDGRKSIFHHPSGDLRRCAFYGGPGLLHPARFLVMLHGGESQLGTALGKDFKGVISISIYAAAIPLSFVSPWIALALYVFVAVMWFIPDRRNETPRSKVRGITELKHSELPEIFPRLPLPLHIPFDGLPVGPLPYRGHIVPIGPKLPTPQYPLHSGVATKDLPRREALEHLHNPSWRHFRMRTAEQMNVILVRPNRFHLNRKPFRNLGRRLLEDRRHRLIQQRLPVFHGKDNMVVDLPRTMRSLSNCIVPLVRHTHEGTRKDCPRSKLRGISS